MRARVLLAALVAAAAPSSALGVLDGGPAGVAVAPGAWAERTALLDLWDAGDPPSPFRVVAPDGVEARVAPAPAPSPPWQPAGDVRMVAGLDPGAAARGEDGVYAFSFRVPMPAQPGTLLVLVAEEREGGAALALATALVPAPSPEPAPVPGLPPPQAPAASPPAGSPISLGFVAAGGALLLWAQRRAPRL